MTHRLRRESISEPGPVKGDHLWAGVRRGDGNEEGAGERGESQGEQPLQE